MSRTRPISESKRAENYAQPESPALTAKQARRLRHKAGHLEKRWSGRPKAT